MKHVKTCEKCEKKGEAGEFIETNVKKAGGVKLDSPAKTGGSSKPMPAEISGEVMQDNAEVSGKDPKKKGSFWSRLFGKKEKEKTILKIYNRSIKTCPRRRTKSSQTENLQ